MLGLLGQVIEEGVDVGAVCLARLAGAGAALDVGAGSGFDHHLGLGRGLGLVEQAR